MCLLTKTGLLGTTSSGGQSYDPQMAKMLQDEEMENLSDYYEKEFSVNGSVWNLNLALDHMEGMQLPSLLDAHVLAVTQIQIKILFELCYANPSSAWPHHENRRIMSQSRFW